MSEKKEPTATPPAEPVADPAPATPPSSDPVVTPENVQLPDGFELIRTEDKNKIISARDKANNGNSELETVVSSMLQKDAIKDAVGSADFKANYPDVTLDELLEADPEDTEQIFAIAKAKQERYETVKQNHLKNVQVATAPTISKADKETQLKELKKPSLRSRFQDGLKIQRARVK